MVIIKLFVFFVHTFDQGIYLLYYMFFEESAQIVFSWLLTFDGVLKNRIEGKKNTYKGDS